MHPEYIFQNFSTCDQHLTSLESAQHPLLIIPRVKGGIRDLFILDHIVRPRPQGTPWSTIMLFSNLGCDPDISKSWGSRVQRGGGSSQGLSQPQGDLTLRGSSPTAGDGSHPAAFSPIMPFSNFFLRCWGFGPVSLPDSRPTIPWQPSPHAVHSF